MHVLNALLVFGIARAVARLTLPISTLIAMLFAVLPIHAESVGWIQGLSDSVPAFFYLASFASYGVWRRYGATALYWASVGLFFLALFSRQSAVTLPVAIVIYDLLVMRPRARSVWSFMRPYTPFVALLIGYLALRLILFGQAVREDALGPAVVASFGEVQLVALQQLVFGGM